jgi:hypothetical protein
VYRGAVVILLDASAGATNLGTARANNNVQEMRRSAILRVEVVI